MTATYQRDEDVSIYETRAIVKCKTCGRVGNLPYTITTKRWAFNGRPASSQTVTAGGREYGIYDRHDFDRALHNAARHGCEAGWKVTVVKGVFVLDKRCGPRCMGATGPNCECTCGGENHGVGHGSW